MVCEVCDVMDGVCIKCGKRIDQQDVNSFQPGHAPEGVVALDDFESTFCIDKARGLIGLAFRMNAMTPAAVYLMSPATARAYAKGILNTLDAMEVLKDEAKQGKPH